MMVVTHDHSSLPVGCRCRCWAVVSAPGGEEGNCSCRSFQHRGHVLAGRRGGEGARGGEAMTSGVKTVGDLS